MGEKVLKPQLRFKGFNGDWEKRKLGDFGSVCMNKRIFKNQTTEKGEIPFYKIGTFGGHPDAFISRSLFEEYKLKYPYPICGDILISASGSIGRTVEYQGEEAYFQDSNIVWLNHRNSIYNPFLKYFYAVVKWRGIEGSTIKRLYNENILNTQITVPKKAEQSKIGDFFNSLDNLITLEQRKLDKLGYMKKALLEKMFPKNNSHVPEIRFKGFDGDWEERKLGEISNSYSGGTPTVGNREYYDGDIPFIRSGEISKNKTELFISEKALKNTSAKLVNKGDILYALYGATSGEVSRAQLDGAINQAVLSINPSMENDADFIVEWLRKEKLKIISTFLQGGQGNLSGQIVKQLEIKLACKSEQQKIGTFFSSLDNLIALHQRKLEKLKNIKKSCLNKMFV